MLSGECLIIRADASTEIGAGHLMRCLALAQAWQDAGGKVVFITACQSEGLLQRLRQEKVELYQLPGSYPDPVDWEHTRRVISAHPDAWVVLDGYHFDHTYQRLVKEAGHRLMVIDDLVHFQHYYADIVFNQNLHAEQLHYPVEPYTRLLLGTRYVLLRREFRTWQSRPREIPEVARRVLVTLGGGDPENHTLRVIQALQKQNIPDLEATVIIGASNPHADTLQAAIRQSHIRVRLVRDAQDMPALMADADAAISGGGGTCWELTYLGVPMLVLAWAPNQEPNTRLLQERGAASAIILKDMRSPEMMTRLIEQLLSDQPARAAMSQMGRTIVDGKGAQRVIEAMSGGATKPERCSLEVVFLGGKQAGCVGLLTTAAAGCRVKGVVAADGMVANLATGLGLPTFASVRQAEVEQLLAESDLLVSVHWPEIVPQKLLELPRLGGINAHPCLYRYKGLHPIERLLKDGATRASVGVHRMTERVDEGEVLAEEFVDVTGKKTVDEVYNVLYPFYALTLLKVLRALDNTNAKH